MTSDDEYVSCEEPPVNNCRNKSRVKRNFTRHSVDFDHSISLGKMLNALRPVPSFSNFRLYRP